MCMAVREKAIEWVSGPFRARSASPAMEQLLDVAAQPRIGSGCVGEHRDDAGPGSCDGGDTVRAEVPAEQGERAGSAAHRANAGAVALEQAAHTLPVLVICAAQHRHVLELAPAERRLQHQRDDGIRPVEMPAVPACLRVVHDVQRAELVGVPVQDLTAQSRTDKGRQLVRLISDAERGTGRDLIVSQAALGRAHPGTARITGGKVRIIGGEVDVVLGVGPVGVRHRLHRPVRHGGNRRRPHEPSDLRRAGGGEYSRAARHEILPGRTAQTIDRVPLKVNYIGKTADGDTSAPLELEDKISLAAIPPAGQARKSRTAWSMEQRDVSYLGKPRSEENTQVSLIWPGRVPESPQLRCPADPGQAADATTRPRGSEPGYCAVRYRGRQPAGCRGSARCRSGRQQAMSRLSVRGPTAVRGGLGLVLCWRVAVMARWRLVRPTVWRGEPEFGVERAVVGAGQAAGRYGQDRTVPAGQDVVNGE